MNKTLALAAVLAAPSLASAAKTEAILAFDEGGTEAVRYYSRKGAVRSALPGEPDKLIVDAVAGSPSVTAILVSFSGAPALDKDDAEARLFAFGDTVNARVRQATGGKRGITGGVLGPVTIDPAPACDLNALSERALDAAKADLASTDVVLILAPQAACRFSGAATLGRVLEGKRRIAVAWAFGDNWVASSAHAIAHAMGERHAAQPASDDFGWAAAAKRHKKADTLVAKAEVDPAAAEQTGLRDAPAMMRPAPGLGFRPALGAAPRHAEPLSRMALPTRPLSASKALGATECREGAKNLRYAARAASSGVTAMGGLIARQRLASAVKRQEAALASKDVPADVEVSLLTTEAETELHVALVKLQDAKTSAKELKDDVLPGVARAADSLEQAARRMKRG